MSGKFKSDIKNCDFFKMNLVIVTLLAVLLSFLVNSLPVEDNKKSRGSKSRNSSEILPSPSVHATNSSSFKPSLSIDSEPSKSSKPQMSSDDYSEVEDYYDDTDGNYGCYGYDYYDDHANSSSYFEDGIFEFIVVHWL